MAKTIKVEPKVLFHCYVKAERAELMTRDEVVGLMGWCDCQAEDLWEDMSLQEILNVYRATAEYDTFEGFAEEDWKSAYKAWNRAVINPNNKMIPRHNA